MVPIGVIEVIAVAIVLAMTVGKGSGMRRCRWLSDQRRARETATERWICSRCGVEAFTHDGRPPSLCKRHLRNPSL